MGEMAARLINFKTKLPLKRGFPNGRSTHWETFETWKNFFPQDSPRVGFAPWEQGKLERGGGLFLVVSVLMCH